MGTEGTRGSMPKGKNRENRTQPDRCRRPDCLQDTRLRYKYLPDMVALAQPQYMVLLTNLVGDCPSRQGPHRGPPRRGYGTR